jgi:hypothetical protein
MFSLNNELHHLDATVAEVAAVYRSLQPVMLAPEGRRRELCSAFLCLMQKGGREQIQGALYLNSSHETLVYTASATISNLPSQEVIGNGLGFFEGMGFRMEECNLGGSVALRTMIVESLKIFQQNSSRETTAAVPVKQEVKQEVKQGRPAAPLEGEVATLQAELQNARQQYAALAAESSARTAAMENELAAAKAELAVLRSDCEAATTNNELSSLQEEYEALRAEYMLINDELSARNAELLQLRGELEAARQAGRPSGLETDRAQLLASADFTPGAVSAAPRHSSLADLDIAPASAEDATPFHLESSLRAVPCHTPEELAELRVSFNVIRLGIVDASRPQNCSAYICGLDRKGAKEIYVAIHQIEGKKNLIYAPARQPENSADYERVMQDAIDFTDVTGFIINLANIGKTAQEKMKAIEQTPVFTAA